MKIWNFVVIFTGVAILMALAGLNVAGFTDLFNIIGITISNSGIESVNIQSTLWSRVFGTTGLLVTAVSSSIIVIGLYVTTKDKSLFVIPIITGVLFYWISTIISIINYIKPYPVFGFIVGAILMALTTGFIVSCVEWFLGQDN